MVLLGVLKNSNDSDWGAPYFAQPKPLRNQVWFLSDFINLNKQFNQKPYPIPKINGNLLKLEVFLYATSLGLNIVYYYICCMMNYGTYTY